MTDGRYSKVREITDVRSVPPVNTKSDAPIEIRTGKWRMIIPTGALGVSLGLFGSLFFRPQVDVSRLESKIDRVDSQVGQINDALRARLDNVEQRQRRDSDSFTNAINELGRIDEKHDRQIERISEQYAALAERVGRERRQ